MTLTIPFDNSYARLPDGFFHRQLPTRAETPQLLAYNETLGAELRIAELSTDARAEIFSGHTVPEGAEPLAQIYAGHQFGNFNPQLGDGRALLLGEVIDENGLRRDIQLKGSGPTPFSRRGDGLAWLGPVLREYVVSEAFHALGIPTTRALAATTTGADVYRETRLPGAILTRVAASHLRVGTFQIFAHRDQKDALRTLTQYAIDRHYPDADGPMGLLRAVCQKQAELIPAWMSVGFIHGVMNTDNCTISGETIDYGPCAFIDTYHANTVFSSIDEMGRYAYSNQPRIAVWNMAQFATALIHQMDNRDAAIEEATAIIHEMPALLEREWERRFTAKIGIAIPQDKDGKLVADLLLLMQQDKADFTNTFSALRDGSARDQMLDRDAYDAWHVRWQQRLADEKDPEPVMAAANPRIIPRNHRIENMIAAALADDLGPFNRLITALADPYHNDDMDLRKPPRPEEAVYATFCGT